MAFDLALLPQNFSIANFFTKFSNERTFLIDNNFLTIELLTIDKPVGLTMINL